MSFWLLLYHLQPKLSSWMNSTARLKTVLRTVSVLGPAALEHLVSLNPGAPGGTAVPVHIAAVCGASCFLCPCPASGDWAKGFWKFEELWLG